MGLIESGSQGLRGGLSPCKLSPQGPFSACLRLPNVYSDFQGGFPAESNPLLDIVGHSLPERLGGYFKQPSNPKLPQSYFGLDPGVRKFGKGAPGAINLLRAFRLHFLSESNDRIFHHAADAPPRAVVAGTALPLMRTGSACVELGPEGLTRDSRSNLPSLVDENLAGWTTVRVRGCIIGEGFRIIGFANAPAAHLRGGLATVIS